MVLVSAELIKMLTPSARYLTATDHVNNVLNSAAHQPSCYEVHDQWQLIKHETGSSILPPVDSIRFHKLSASPYIHPNNFLSAKSFPFPIDAVLPGTISGYLPSTRSVAVRHQQILHSFEQHESPPLGIKLCFLKY